MKTYVFTNRVYPPTGGATGELLRELAEGLVRDGARVVVVTSRRDQRLKGLKDQGTKGRPGSEERRAERRREMVNGVEVIRVGTTTFTRASHWRRALSYAFLYPQFAWQVRRLGSVDAVVSMTDPPLQVAVVTLAACKARKKLHWAQDVYPELAEELGVIGRGGWLARVLRSASTWALRRQDEVVAVGRCMRERLIGRGVDAAKIEVIPNWSPVGAVSPEVVDAKREQLGWEDDFVALYSGNLGLAHDFETLVDAAKALEGGGVRIVFAGEGPRLEQVRQATAGCGHVSFLPPQPREDLGAFLAAADAHLVTVRAGLAGLVVPSKIYGILAVGRPVLYAGPPDSEVAQLLRESGAGVGVENGDAAVLATALCNLASNPHAARSMGEAARRVAHDCTFAKALAKWQEVLREG